jgi:hypothetical protein
LVPRGQMSKFIVKAFGLALWVERRAEMKLRSIATSKRSYRHPERSYRRPVCSIKAIHKASNEYFGCHCEERSIMTILMRYPTCHRDCHVPRRAGLTMTNLAGCPQSPSSP